MINLDNPLVDLNYRISLKEMEDVKNKVEEFISDSSGLIDKFDSKGRGIVITAGGLKYYTCAFILVNSLRDLGCVLPIEIWYYKEELTVAMRSSFPENVHCRDISDFVEDPPHGFLMKPLSILFSSFEDVLYLDADNCCVKDPTFMFEDQEYLKTQCIFWPDYWVHSSKNQIWEILGISPIKGFEQESGQLLLNKKRYWRELELTVFLNNNCEFFYNFMYGDKDTFQIAWLCLHSSFYMINKPVGSCGYIDVNRVFIGITMTQHDPNGDLLFLHRNLLKWDVTKLQDNSWQYCKEYLWDAKEKSCMIQKKDKGNFINLIGDVLTFEVDDSIIRLEEICLRHLTQLRKLPFYTEELITNYIDFNR